MGSPCLLLMQIRSSLLFEAARTIRRSSNNTPGRSSLHTVRVVRKAPGCEPHKTNEGEAKTPAPGKPLRESIRIYAATLEKNLRVTNALISPNKRSKIVEGSGVLKLASTTALLRGFTPFCKSPATPCRVMTTPQPSSLSPSGVKTPSTKSSRLREPEQIEAPVKWNKSLLLLSGEHKKNPDAEQLKLSVMGFPIESNSPVNRSAKLVIAAPVSFRTVSLAVHVVGFVGSVQPNVRDRLAEVCPGLRTTASHGF